MRQQFYLQLIGFYLMGSAAMVCAQAQPQLATWQDPSIPDTVRLEVLDSLARKVYWTQQADSSLYFLEQMMQLARSSQQEGYLRRGLRRKAELYYQTGNYQAAVPANEERIAAYQVAPYDKDKRKRFLSRAHRDLAKSLRKLGRTTEALEQYELSLGYAENAGKAGRKEYANTLNSLGNLYLNLREYELAQRKYQLALDIYQALEFKLGIYSALNNLGLASAKTGDYSQAIEYYEISLEMKKAANDRKRMANTYGSIGDVYLVWGRKEEARTYFLEAKALQEELGLRDELTRSLTQLGNLANQEGQAAEALSWCTQSCAIAAEDQLWQASLACHECLYRAHKALGNAAMALQAHEAFIAVKDSVLNQENAQAIAALETRLTYEKQLAETETERLRLANKAKQERWLRWLLLGAVLVLALITWLALRIGRLRRQQNEKLTQKNEQISQQAIELEAVAQLKSRFFANISHELRTPLTLVISPLEQLLRQKDQLSSQLKTTLSTVRSNANKLLKLVEELLELSQLEAGTVRANETTLNLESFIRQVFENYQLLAQENCIAYSLNWAIEPNLHLKTDANLLEKVIDNLLSNAFKFTPPAGQVKMVVKTDAEHENQLLVQVEDSGPGIATEDLEHIFDRYYRGAQNAKQPSNGFGIGLALAQEAAQLLGGFLSVESTPEMGSIFSLHLPMAESTDIVATAELPSDNRKNEEKTTALNPIDSGNQRILIVEDNPELQAFLSEVLADFNCSHAKNGQQALAMLQEAQERKSPYHLVLTDLMMPEMSGDELIQEMRQKQEWDQVRIVVLTARHKPSEKLALLRFGIDDYLHKPFSPEELLARIQNLLRYQIPQVKPEEEIRLATDRESVWLKKVEELIEQALLSGQELNTNILASACNLSNRQLLRKIKAATGMSTQKYIQECKLQLARQFLEQRRYVSLSALAKACGFSTVGYFNSLFFKRFGKHPSELLLDERK